MNVIYNEDGTVEFDICVTEEMHGKLEEIKEKFGYKDNSELFLDALYKLSKLKLPDDPRITQYVERRKKERLDQLAEEVRVLIAKYNLAEDESGRISGITVNLG